MRKTLIAGLVCCLLLICSSVFAAATTTTNPNSETTSKDTSSAKAASPTVADTVVDAAAVPSAQPEDKLIKHGMRGSEVEHLQKLLANAGFYPGQIDGVFGNITLRAVKEFQHVNGLPADGVVGKETLQYLERSGSEPSRYSRVLTMTATAYTRFDDGCGNYTARGNFLRKGLVAVDPSVIPLGTRLYIEGYGYAIADDTGGAIKGNKIDLAYESRSEALNFGRQKVTVYILD